MLEPEARWIAGVLARLGDDGFPLLDVGSAPAEFRERTQPWIERDLFAPLRARGRAVVHLDARPGEGVDVVGSVLDPPVTAVLAARGFRTVLCSNVLEHVPAAARREASAALLRIAGAGGRVIATVPRRYPWHPDPIDTLFRPGVEELAACFPGARLEESAAITAPGLAAGLAAEPRRLLRLFVRLLVPWYRPAGWVEKVRSLPYLRGPLEVTCVVVVAGG